MQSFLRESKTFDRELKSFVNKCKVYMGEQMLLNFCSQNPVISIQIHTTENFVEGERLPYTDFATGLTESCLFWKWLLYELFFIQC